METRVIMICGTLILAGSLMALQKPADKAAHAAATERVTLRDGSVVLGLVTAVSTGPRGAVELLVRRDWAESHVKTWAGKWSRAIEAGSKLAARQRRERLGAWRGERAASAPADDRIVAWIDQELKRLDDPAVTTRTLVEALGLGTIPAEFKRRSLKLGATTEKALGAARGAINQDLNALLLPIFENPAGTAVGADHPVNRESRELSRAAEFEQVRQGQPGDSLLGPDCHVDFAARLVPRSGGNRILQGDDPAALGEIIAGCLDLLVSDRVRGFHKHRELGTGVLVHLRRQLGRERAPIGLQSWGVNRCTQLRDNQEGESDRHKGTGPPRQPGQALGNQDQVGGGGVKRVPGWSENGVPEPGINVQDDRGH